MDLAEREVSVVLQEPTVQRALLLRGPRLRYELVHDHPLPTLERDDEVLLRVECIGLNPIDWKSADFGFGLPSLPAVNGRDLAGVVLQVGPAVTRLQIGDRVFGPSTQYRDYRTSAFQSVAVAAESSLGRVPAGVSLEVCAGMGVGAVTAALAVGNSFGLPVGSFAPRDLAVGAEGEDGHTQCAAEVGDWLLIWGGSSVTGFFAAQFARLAGMKVIAVADTSRHGDRLRSIGIEHIVDRKDTAAAVEEVIRLTKGKLRYALDCIGRDTATLAVQTLDPTSDSVLVGLSGFPKELPPRVHRLEVPVKTFHSNPAVGRALMSLIEELLDSGELTLPPVEVVVGGLESVNGALDRLRAGSVSFGRLVIQTASDPYSQSGP